MRSKKHTMTGQKMAWLAGVAGAVSLAAGAGMPGQARATVYLSNNFNNNGTGLGAGWTAPNGDVTDTGTESAFTNITGGNSALLDSSANTGLLSPTLSGFTTSDPIQISFDFDITAANQSNNDTFLLNNRNIILNFGSSATKIPNTPSAMVYKNGSNAVTASFTPSLNTWYRIILGLSAENAALPSWNLNVINISGQSLYSAANIHFSNTLAPYSSFNYSFNVPTPVSGASFQIDNVLVQSPVVPEPAEISLVGLGGLGLLILSPRRRARR